MIKQLSPLRRKDIETGRKLEREAIVKWLRENHCSFETDCAADDIEAGEHLK